MNILFIEIRSNCLPLFRSVLWAYNTFVITKLACVSKPIPGCFKSFPDPLHVLFLPFAGFLGRAGSSHCCPLAQRRCPEDPQQHLASSWLHPDHRDSPGPTPSPAELSGPGGRERSLGGTSPWAVGLALWPDQPPPSTVGSHIPGERRPQCQLLRDLPQALWTVRQGRQ